MQCSRITPGGIEDRLLRDEAKLLAEPAQFQGSQVPPVQRHSPLLPPRQRSECSRHTPGATSSQPRSPLTQLVINLSHHFQYHAGSARRCCSWQSGGETSTRKRCIICRQRVEWQYLIYKSTFPFEIRIVINLKT